MKSVQVALVAAWAMFDGGGACLDVIWSLDKAFLFLGQVFLQWSPKLTWGSSLRASEPSNIKDMLLTVV